MRSPALHRWLHAMACLAMMLVVIAPMISRALAHPMATGAQATEGPVAHPQAVASDAVTAHPLHHAMAHGMDHAQVAVPDTGKAASSAATPATPADPHAEHDMGVDCEYCLIAARMISLLVAVLLLIALWPAIFRAVTGVVAPWQFPSSGTLGARGPPPALAC